MLTKAFSVTLDGDAACTQNFAAARHAGRPPCPIQLFVRVLAKHQWIKRGQKGVKLQDTSAYTLLRECELNTYPLRDGEWGFGALQPSTVL